MRYFCILVSLLSLIACNQNDEIVLHNDIMEYKGCWRDTIYSGDDVIIEDIIIIDNSIKYTMSDVNTHVILDTLNGTIMLGNENKMEWNCYAPITNTTRQVRWNVLDLSKYQMKLYSNLLGDRVFRKTYYPSVEEYLIHDTLLELRQYGNYLPLHKDELLGKYGEYNSLLNERDITYYVNHPLIDKITFNGNYDNDSVYSYTLTHKENDWCKIDSFVRSGFTRWRDVDGTTEYIDADVIENSNNVIIVDSALHQIRYQPIKDYDYWPNISHYIGEPIQVIKKEYEGRYAYSYKEKPNDETFEYQYYTVRDSVSYFVGFASDENGTIIRCGIELFYHFREIKDAQKKCAEIASILNRKYSLEGYDTKNNIYNYCSGPFVTNLSYNIKLRIKQYPGGVGYYRIQLLYEHI